jgi:quinol monooxygenase YgiN
MTAGPSAAPPGAAAWSPKPTARARNARRLVGRTAPNPHEASPWPRYRSSPGTRSKKGTRTRSWPSSASSSRRREEPGNLAFDSYRKTGDRRSYVLLERYESREALDAHRQAPHFTGTLVTQIVPLLETRTIEEYDVPD